MSFVISPSSIAQAQIKGVEASYTYTGSQVKPAPVVKLGGKALVEGVDYRVSYSKNTDVGEGFVYVDGMGNYTGSAVASFAISKAAYDLTGVSFEGATVGYDGKAHSLAISGQLPYGLKVSYSGNGMTSAGDHVVTATFAGDANHEPVASMSATLTIEKAIVSVPTAVEGLTYTGRQQVGVRASGPYALRGNTAANAGSYEATASLDDPENYQWANGSSNDQKINWSIGKAQLIAAYTGEVVEYGDVPSLSVEVTGFVNGESATSAAGYSAPTVQATSIEAGTYKLMPAGGSADNYEFAYFGGSLVVEKAPVTVVANAAFKVYGQDDPALTYEVLGAPENAVAGCIQVSRAVGEDVGEYAVSVSAAENDNYRITVFGSKFTIVKADYDMSGVTLPDRTFAYTGQPYSLQVAGNLPSGVSVSYTGNGKVDAGVYAVTASFAGDANHNPIADMAATLTVQKATIDVPEAASDLVYTGNMQTAVQSDSRYSVLGGSAKDAGLYRAIVILSDPENYAWADGLGTFREVPWSIAKCSLNASPSTSVKITGLSNKTYSGVAQTQSPKVSVNGVALAEGVDYAVSYSNNLNAGTATVTVVGQGNYTGEASAEFTISKASIKNASVSGLKTLTYNGKAQTQQPVVKVGSKTLKKGTDYTVVTTGNKNAGKATVTITGKGNYKGTAKTAFTIAKAANPAKVTVAQKAVKLADVKKKAQAASPISVAKAQGAVTYAKVASGSSSYLSVNKTTGKVTVKKGTKKGTYTIKVKVSVAGNANYKALTKTVTAKVQVK